MNMILKWLIYFASAWISIKFADGYWVVGTVFGLAVVAWGSDGFRHLKILRHTAFLIASILIYALVYWIAMWKWESRIELLNYLIGPFPMGVVLGSILLPYMHKFSFKRSRSKTVRVIAFLIVSFYLVMLSSYSGKRFLPEVQINFAAVAIVIWQGLYFYLFFIRPKSGHVRREKVRNLAV